MMLDHDMLKLVWWLLIGLLFIGFAVTDGFDMGVGALLPFLGRSDAERRVMINAVGATWEGNQTWLVTAVGATFAAWPTVYATAFSSLYVVIVVVLLALFLRPVGFDYRSKLENARWRTAWDWALCIGSAVPALVLGLAIGQVLLGLPFSFDDSMRVTRSPSLAGALHPFALLCGALSLSMLVMHGAFWLLVRTEGVVVLRAQRAARMAALLSVVCFAAAAYWLATGLEGYRIAPTGAIERAPGAWRSNYLRDERACIVPLVALAGPLAALALARLGWTRLAFAASALSVVAVIASAGVALFPFVLPSSSDPAASLTAWNAASSRLTLQIMLFAVVLLLPLVAIYTAWAYRVMRGRISVRTVADNPHGMY